VKKYSMLAFTLIIALGLGSRANAQGEERVVVNVPFEFFAGGKMLPAGSYTISSLSSDNTSSLVIASRSDGAFVLPAAFDDVPVENVQLSFDHIGGAYLLSAVKTRIGTYSIGTSREEARLTRLAQAGMTSSGTP
jgi:hypothetical protein